MSQKCCVCNKKNNEKPKEDTKQSDAIVDLLVDKDEQKTINGEKYVNYEGLCKMIDAAPKLTKKEKEKMKEDFKKMCDGMKK